MSLEKSLTRDAVPTPKESFLFNLLAFMLFPVRGRHRCMRQTDANQIERGKRVAL